MTARKYSSVYPDKTLNTSMPSASSGDSNSMVLNSADGVMSSTPYTLVIEPNTNSEEIVTVVAVSGANLTVLRGQDGTSAPAHPNASPVKHMVTARDLSEPQIHINASSGTHGITGSFVGTTDSQTLTNKTLTSPTISNPTISGGITGTGVVSSDNIADGTIVNADINSSAAIDPSKVAGTAVITTDSRLSDTRTPTDGTVTTAKLADGAVTSAKIADGAIVTADIADSAVTSAKIADLNVTTAKVADLNVTTGKIADASVTTSKLADSSVTSAKIVDGTIVDGDISSSAAIAQSKISGLATSLNNLAFKPSTGVGASSSTDISLGTSATTLDTFDLVLTEQCSVAIISTIMVNVSASANNAYFGVTVTGATSSAYSSSAIVGNVNGQTSVTVIKFLTMNSGTNHIYIQGYRTGTGTWTAQNVASMALPIKAFA